MGHAGFSDGLYKTDDFLRAQPFGNMPAAFSPDGGTRHIRIKQHYEGSSSAWGPSVGNLWKGPAHDV